MHKVYSAFALYYMNTCNLHEGIDYFRYREEIITLSDSDSIEAASVVVISSDKAESIKSLKSKFVCTDGVPGKDWWQRFLKHWPSLTERKPQHLSKSRAEAGDTGIIWAWFDKVEEVLSSTGLDPSDPATAAHLWNCDETAFCRSVSATKLLVCKGTKMVHKVGGGSGREYTTVHCLRRKASTVHFVQRKELVPEMDGGWPSSSSIWDK